MTQSISQQKVLIVDDTPENIDVLGGILKPYYKRSVALTGEKALKIAASKEPPDVILLDIMMPGTDGYEVCRRLKEDEKTKHIPVIFVTTKREVADETKGFELGAVDYITKPVSPPIVLARLKTHLELKLAQEEMANQNVILDKKVRERTAELTLTQEVTIESMATLAEHRDPETGGHIKRTKNYVRALAEQLVTHLRFCRYLDDEVIDLLYKSAPLHDIGKIAVEDGILLKPGKLTDEEFEIMKKHTVYGNNAISASESRLGANSFLRIAREIAHTHHEKWDGTGYPQGLSGDGIPIPGRLMAVADVYDALISKRIYKPAFSHQKAVGIVVEGRGTQFDPDILDAFLEIEDDFRQIALEFADSEEGREALEDQGDDRQMDTPEMESVEAIGIPQSLADPYPACC